MARRMATQQTDVLVIGAGPSGTSAAALMRQAGFKVAIVEKEKFPRFVIGESLLPRCMDLLQEAGLLEAIKKQAYIKKHGAVFLRGSDIRQFNFAEQFTMGWPYTYQVPRDHFDYTLAREAQSFGVDILWQHRVTDVDFSGKAPAATVVDQNGTTSVIASRFILDASGYGRVLPRLLNLNQPSELPLRESLFTHVTGDRRPQGVDEGMIWICMLPENGWLWIIPFANGKTSVGVVAKPEFIDRLPGSDSEKLREAFALEENGRARLAETEFCFPAKRIKGYSISVSKLFGDHYALLGNATEFLDPVFSSGVTLALESANRAANILIRQLRGEPVDWQTEYADYMMAGVETFRTYVHAWYDGRLPTIFFSSLQDPEYRKQICSVLAGYVWDADNPCVSKHAKAVDRLATLVAMRSK
jgi:flavin-dependent dehydrogenase